MKNFSSRLFFLALLVSGCSKTSDPIPVPKPAVSSLDCGGTTYSAVATALASYTSTAMVSYGGGNGIAYPASAAIPSSGVTGLTATLVAGALANGNGKLTYNITGTPATSGIAAFPISMGVQTCSLNLQVAPTFVGSWTQTTTMKSGCVSSNATTTCSSNCLSTWTATTITNGSLVLTYTTTGNNLYLTDSSGSIPETRSYTYVLTATTLTLTYSNSDCTSNISTLTKV
jgi:hypothetical protein